MTSRAIICIVAGVLALLTGISQLLVPAPDTSGKTPLVWTTDPNPQREPQVDSFNEMYPDCKLRIDPDNSEMMKVIVQCSANMGPDIIGHVGQSSYETYHAAGLLMDVTDQAKAMGFGPETLHPAIRPMVMLKVFTDEGKFEERQFVYPCNVYHTFLIYNKNLFDKYNVPYPPKDLTWEKYEEIAKKLTIFKDGAKLPTSFGGAGVKPEVLIWEFGGDFLNKDGTRCTLDSDAVIDAMVYFHKLHYELGIEPNPAQKTGMSSQGGWGGGYITWFGESKVGMFWGARWCLIQLRRIISEQKQMLADWTAANPNGDPNDAPPQLRMGACLVPRPKNGKRYTQYGARCAAINAKSENREKALKFMQYLASEPYCKHINDGADSKPGNKKYNKIELFGNPEWPGEEEVHQVSLDAVPDGRLVPRSPFITFQVLNRPFTDARQRIIAEEKMTRKQIAEIMKTATHEVDVKIARAISRTPRLRKMYDALLAEGAEPTAIKLEEND